MQATPQPIATRQRILDVALELFSAQGYHRTSVQAIADRVGLTKAAVHYHFPRKVDLLLFIIEPVWRDFETMVAAVETLPEPRWPLVEGYLDVMFKHRSLFRMVYHDPSLIAHEGTYARLIALGQRTTALLAGPDPDIAMLVRSAQLMSMLGDPIVMLPDVSSEQLRQEILAGARRLLDDAPESVGTRAAQGVAGHGHQQSRRGPGRPAALTPDDQRRVRRMHADGRPAEEIAAVLGVSRATIYRCLTTPL